MRLFCLSAVALVVSLFTCPAALAHIELPSFFSDGMVLQSDMPIKIWGQAAPAEELRVALGNQFEDTTASAAGSWSVQFAPLKSGTSCQLHVNGSGGEQICIKDVLLGDVFVCSGQSNMYRTVDESCYEKSDINRSADPWLRVFMTNIHLAAARADGRWKQASPGSVLKFSALPYYLGRELRETRHVPIGIITCAYPGSPISSWMKQSTLNRLDEAGLNNALVPNASLHQSVIQYFAGLRARALVWYQGESDVWRPKSYPQMFSAFVHDWREEWRLGDIPVFYVQLPNYGEHCKGVQDSFWAAFRECQSAALSIPNCFMAVTYDTSKEKNVPLHPGDKRLSAHRIAMLVRSHVYKEPIDAESPSPDNIWIEGNAVVCRYNSQIPLKTSDNSDRVKGFELAGQSGIFFSATGVIRGDRLIVQSPEVDQPVYVRYAWSDNPSINLYTAIGVPFRSFRTDHISCRAKYLPVEVRAALTPALKEQAARDAGQRFYKVLGRKALLFCLVSALAALVLAPQMRRLFSRLRGKSKHSLDAIDVRVAHQNGSNGGK